MHKDNAFTLIELSIVLVIIGLIVGGVLVGRDLIASSAVRAQVTQIEKYQSATNTFREKYNYLPGDIKDPEASNYGFAVRGSASGQGDGNAVVEGCQSNPNCSNSLITGYQGSGESQLFWMDLSSAKLINAGFKLARCCSEPWDTAASTGDFSEWLPLAALGNRNYVFVVSTNSTNYFYISQLISSSGWALSGVPALTVKQAAMLDAKIDDGFPQNGNVLAKKMGWGYVGWVGSADTSATAGSASTCYDNNNLSGAMQQYSITQGNGAYVNCALSFKFQ